MRAIQLLPEGVSYYFSAEKQGAGVLTVNELALAEKYGAKRFTDFCTGRHCLRQCTAPLGYAGDILMGERGAPVLPGNITASLSHSKKLCGAIAGKKDRFLSLGIDIETCGRVKKDMWYLLFTKNETALLDEHDDERRDLLSTAFFSLKEAFYKLQYPLTGVFIDFPEVEIVIINNRFYIKLLRHVSGLFPEGRIVRGSVFRYNNEVVTYCSLPASPKL